MNDNKKKNRELDINKWEKVKDDLHLIVMNYDLNKEFLKNVPHVPFLNLAFCVCAIQKKCADPAIAIVIQYSHMEDWGVDLQELFRMARDNTYHMKNIFVDSMDHVLQSIMEDTWQPTENGEESSMIVVTNKRQSYGASMIGNIGLLLTLAERLDSDLYILPSSVHELIVIPSTRMKDVAVFREMVRDVNRKVLEEGDYLSDEVYYFDRESHSVTVAQVREEVL